MTTKCTPAEDLELVRRFQSGDSEAIRTLFQIHNGLIKYWVRQLLSWADEEEIMEEAYVALYEAIEKFRVSDGEDFHSHIRTSIRRAVYKSREVRRVNRTAYRNSKKVAMAQAELIREFKPRSIEEVARKAELSVRQVKSAVKVVAFPEPLDKAVGLFTEDDPYERQLVRDTLKRLSSYEAQLISLHYYDGYTDPEVGRMLGKKASAIKAARIRAEAKFRAIISGEEGKRDGK